MPAPTGPEWLVIDEARLWLPEDIRPRLNHPFPPVSMLQTGGPGWAITRAALAFMLQAIHGNRLIYEIEWVDKIGEGLSKATYRADVTTGQASQEKHDVFAVSHLLPDADADAGARVIREQFLLDALAGKTAGFSVQKPLGMIWYDGLLISASSFVFGMPLELRAKKSPLKNPWEVVAKIAAEIHNMPTSDLPEGLTRYPTRRDQARSALAKFEGYDLPEIQAALDWITENLPPEQASVFIHGDLLGQNILWSLDGELSVIDWEYARLGDPAYDLAIVTRGVRNPFQTSHGLELFLDAYLSAGGQAVTKQDTQVYELLLCLGWFEQSLEAQSGQGPDFYLDFLRSLLKRVGVNRT